MYNYNYSDLAKASMALGTVSVELANAVNDIALKYGGDAEFMKELAIVDNLDSYLLHGRYLNFVRTLRKLNQTVASHKEDHIPHSHLFDDCVQAVYPYEDVLFECMSSRSDGSFNEVKNLQKWAQLRARFNSKAEDFADWSDFYEFVVRTKGKRFALSGESSPYLLTEMANAIEVGEYLLEFEKNNSSPELDELHSLLKEVGVFDRWLKF